MTRAPKKQPKASGVNIPEEQRHTVAVKLRLQPATTRALDAFAKLRGVNRSAAVRLLLIDACACDSMRKCPVHEPASDDRSPAK